MLLVAAGTPTLARGENSLFQPPAIREPLVELSRFAAGAGPTRDDETLRLLDSAHTRRQSNAAAWPRAAEGPRESLRMHCKLRVLKGGDGGAFAFLSTAAYGTTGPAPFVPSWVKPNLRGTFAVGIDVHDPKKTGQFSAFGNYAGKPAREVSLHWDGHEIVKRVVPAEFRGDFADVDITVRHVIGGADVTVRIAGQTVYDHYFVASMLPYELRLAIGAGTRAEATTEFDVRDVRLVAGPAAPHLRQAQHIALFNHVLTSDTQTAYQSETLLPPADWAFGRVIMTLEIHDAGDVWDGWDRTGEVSVWDSAGQKHVIVPFITSYRTPCRWQIDVTQFRPWLAGKTRFEITAGTTFYKNRGFMLSASLAFHHGVAGLEAYRIVPLWSGEAQYRSDVNHFTDFFTPQSAAIDPETTAARLVVWTTGHSPIGEFTPAKRAIILTLDPAAPNDHPVRFANVLWKDDNYLNPHRPQRGTWQFARAGWAPGDIVHPWEIDLTPHLAHGKNYVLRYEPSPYDFTGEAAPPKPADVAAATHRVHAYLILWRKSLATVIAPLAQIVEVVAGSNAEQAGIRAADYVVSYNERPIAALADLRAAIEAASAAQRTSSTLVLFRGAERLTITVGPGKLGVALSAP